MTHVRDTCALRTAQQDGRALAAFSVYNLEQAQAVCAAAEELRSPVLVQAGSSAFRHAGRGPLAALAIACAEAADADVGVHLDHATDVGEIRACLAAGYGSVMYDGSALAFDRNVEQTRAVVELAHAHGAWVEGELAGIAGDEDASGASASGALTDPEAAARFVRETGVDALAVAIGNVHGMHAGPPALDFDRLAEIRARVDVPLVLHGASGLPEPALRTAVSLGVAKVNVNTELRRAFRAGLEQALADDGLAKHGDLAKSDDLTKLLAPARDAVRDVARSWIALLSGAGVTA